MVVVPNVLPAHPSNVLTRTLTLAVPSRSTLLFHHLHEHIGIEIWAHAIGLRFVSLPWQQCGASPESLQAQRRNEFGQACPAILRFCMALPNTLLQSERRPSRIQQQ